MKLRVRFPRTWNVPSSSFTHAKKSCRLPGNFRNHKVFPPPNILQPPTHCGYPTALCISPFFPVFCITSKHIHTKRPLTLTNYSWTHFHIREKGVPPSCSSPPFCGTPWWFTANKFASLRLPHSLLGVFDSRAHILALATFFLWILIRNLCIQSLYVNTHLWPLTSKRIISLGTQSLFVGNWWIHAVLTVLPERWSRYTVRGFIISTYPTSTPEAQMTVTPFSWETGEFSVPMHQLMNGLPSCVFVWKFWSCRKRTHWHW